MTRVEVDLDMGAYSIIIESGVLSTAGRAIRESVGERRTVVVTDETVKRLYGSTLVDSLREEDITVDELVVEPGESSKSLETAARLYEDLAGLNIDRDSVMLAFGGGVVGDLAGFVGSTFLRGLTVIQIPTTLLAQVDSSVGGKTAVNLSRGKNLVGTFHQPDLVVIDPSVLTTLSPSDVRSGLGEVLKYGLIRDSGFFWGTVENIDLFHDLGDRENLESSISRCCEIKAEVVGRDERDRGIRRILNFGHTIGHGIEAGCGYGKIKHGEAVIWGMIGEIWISFDRGYLEENSFRNLIAALTKLSLPRLPDDLSGADLLDYVRRDKKVRDGRINSVLLSDPGGKVMVEEVSEREIKDAWEFLLDLEVK